MSRSPESRYQEILSVPDVADGNPSTLMSLEQQALQAGIDPISIYLRATSWPVNRFHANMTSDPNTAQSYTDESEAKRLGATAKIYSVASFVEFTCRVALSDEFERDTDKRWNVIQEHQLLGASPAILDKIGVRAIRLATPDVYPKESAIIAAQKLKEKDITISVWNRTAQDYLNNLGISTELHKPYLLDGLLTEPTSFRAGGKTVVMKSSGSGLPMTWFEKLQTGLLASGVDFATHIPISNSNRAERIRDFYSDLGGRTKLIIGYPSELVSVACDLQSRGSAVQMLTLPPRGAHEKRNLEFAMDNNIVIGELSFDRDALTTFDGLDRIGPSDIKEVIASLPGTGTLPKNVIGTKPFWSEQR
ncbi:MAG: hypothetical protein AAB914_01745 [Patescibacteria group bacterium]